MGYPSDLRVLIKHHFEPEDPRGDACKHDRKRVVDAIFYWVKSGVQWRMLPNDPALEDGVRPLQPLEQVRCLGGDAEKTGRGYAGRMRGGNPGRATASLIHKVKPQYVSEERGIDGNKKVKGRSCGCKRHIVVGILGKLLHVGVHTHGAQAPPTSTARWRRAMMRRAKELYPGIRNFSGDAGYRGTAVRYADEELGITLHISEKVKDGFAILPKRWVVERTFAWLGDSAVWPKISRCWPLPPKMLSASPW